MILEYAAVAAALVLLAAAVVLVTVLTLTARPNDDGVYELAELAAMHRGPAGPPWPEPGSQAPCPNPDCRGRRCAAWRRRGIACSEPSLPASLPAYAVGSPVPREGRHSATTAIVRWLAGDWWGAPMPVRLRRQLARMAGAARVPIQHRPPSRRLP